MPKKFQESDFFVFFGSGAIPLTVLQWYYNGITMVLQWYYSVRMNGQNKGIENYGKNPLMKIVGEDTVEADEDEVFLEDSVAADDSLEVG